MSAAKHTPGPWSAGPSFKHNKGSGLCAVFKDGRRLDVESGAFCAADARLIAAAPDLLEALRGLDEAYCRAGTPLTRDERNEDRKRLIAARAAIAKATGAGE